MQATEALTRTIALADECLALHPSHRPENAKQPEEGAEELDEAEFPDHVAVTICNKMLSTAIPVARFRIHVTVEDCKNGSKVGKGDFTVCGTDIQSVKNGLVGLSMERVTVYASLWEQRATGADMLSGYQGDTKTLAFRTWLRDIDQHEIAPTVQ